jgi:apolipoprotein N-acyltransferase
MNAKKAFLISFASWLLLALCFPPLPLGPAALAVLVPWFYVLKTASKKVALTSSYLGNFLFNAISLYWLYYVGDVAPPALIFSGLFFGVAFLSLFALLNAWIFIKIKDMRFKGLPFVFLFPFFWAGIEVLRSKGDMSFPWLSLGLVFGDNIVSMQAFAVFGVFGYSAMIIASNMCIAFAILKREKNFLLVPLALAAFIYISGYGIITFETNAKSTRDNVIEDSLAIAVVQPSIHQTKKWSKVYYDSVMRQTWNLFETLDPDGVALILFPETAIPDYMNMRLAEYEFLKNYASKNNLSILIGALSRVRNDDKKKKYNIYNSAFLFGSGPALEYRKVHLVPFSEKIPFDNVFPVVNYVNLGGGEFSAGDSLSVWNPGNFSSLICYEAIYGSILREAKRKGAKFIANITNDGWFMKSTAPYQHFNLVRSHAVENGIGVVRAANTGISAFIAPNGKILEKTELFEQRIIIHNIPLKTRFTLYSVIGDYVEWVLFAFSLLIILMVIIKKAPSQKTGGFYK